MTDPKQTDITNYPGIIAEVASDWASHVVGNPMVAANFILIVDARGTNQKNATAVLTTEAVPGWLQHALIEKAHEVIGEGFMFIGEGWDEDDE